MVSEDGVLKGEGGAGASTAAAAAARATRESEEEKNRQVNVLQPPPEQLQLLQEELNLVTQTHSGTFLLDPLLQDTRGGPGAPNGPSQGVLRGASLERTAETDGTAGAGAGEGEGARTVGAERVGQGQEAAAGDTLGFAPGLSSSVSSLGSAPGDLSDVTLFGPPLAPSHSAKGHSVR